MSAKKSKYYHNLFDVMYRFLLLKSASLSSFGGNHMHNVSVGHVEGIQIMRTGTIHCIALLTHSELDMSIFVSRPTQDNSMEQIFYSTSSTPTMARKSFELLTERLHEALLSQYAPAFGLLPSHKIKIDDLFFTRYDATLPPKHFLARHW